MNIRPDSACRPVREHKVLARQRNQCLRLDRREHRYRRRTIQWPTRPGTGHLPAPFEGRVLHLLQRRPFPATPERVTDIGHRPLDPRFVLWFPTPGRIHQSAVMMRQFGIGPVDLRVIQIRARHPGPQIVGHQTGRDTTEERERLHMRLGPGLLVHRQHRTHEHHPRHRQHHHERPDPTPAPTHRIDPRTQIPVIDLSFLTRRRVIAQHRHLRPLVLLRKVRFHIPFQRRHRRRQTLLIAQPLPDRLLAHPSLEHRHDVIAVLLDLRPRRLPQPRVGQVREPLPHQLAPLLRRPNRTTRRQPGRYRWVHILLHRLAVQPQAGRDLALRTTCMPVDQDLGHIDHVERSPRQFWLPSPSSDGSSQLPARTTPATARPPGWGIT